MPLLGLTFGSLAQERARTEGNRLFLIDRQNKRRISYSEFAALVESVGKGLLALGVRPGDRVAVLSQTAWHWPVVQFAAKGIGAWLVNLHPAYRETQLVEFLGHADPNVIFVQPRYKEQQYAAQLQDVLIATGKAPSIRCISLGEPIADWLEWDGLIAMGRAISDEVWQAAVNAVDLDDLCMICYTGGTSGTLRGALRTHHSMVNNGYTLAQMIGLKPGDVHTSDFLPYHTAGLDGGTTLCMTAGATLVYAAPLFNPERTMEALVDEQCTGYSCVPTNLQKIMDHPGFDARKLTLRRVVVGGAHCPPDLMRRIKDELGVYICLSYGGTEAGAFTGTVPDDPYERQVGTCGQVGVHSELKIVDHATGRTLSVGEAGEICARGFNTMRGYHKSPEMTAAILDQNGWYHTRDLGVLDEQGFLRVLGRVDGMIIRGGENVFPSDVQSVVRTCPGVVDAEVVGVPDKVYGAEIAAWVIARPDVAEEQIKKHCASYLAFYQRPKYLFFIDSFPETTTGKHNLSLLRTMAAERVGEPVENNR